MIELLQQAVNFFDASSRWNEAMSLWANACNLQGEKRRLRECARNDFNLKMWLIHNAYDMWGFEIRPQAVNIQAPRVTTPQEYFHIFEKKLQAGYDEIHTIANSLVAGGAQPFAKPLYKYVNSLFNELVEVKRFIRECDHDMHQKGKDQWDYHHVSRYQIHDHNVHDHFEEIEEKRGYPPEGGR